MAAKQAEEKALRAAVAADPALRAAAGIGVGRYRRGPEGLRGIRKDMLLLEDGRAFRCHLFQIARMLVRMAEEDGKPNADRLREYRQSNRESLEQGLFSEAPIYDELETIKLADALSMFVTEAGADNDLVVKVLDGKSPRDRAAALIQAAIGRRGRAARTGQGRQGGHRGLERPDDPTGAAGRRAGPQGPPHDGGTIRRTAAAGLRQDRQGPLRRGGQRGLSGRHLHAAPGLRRGEGLRGVGKPQPPWTTIGGAFQHSAEHQNREPFNLPKRWIEGKDKLNPATPFNFVSTADIIGGNSGSPVVNRKGQFVGIIFDGNLQSLVWDFVYTQKEGRAIAVHSAAIGEALRKLYDAGALADELGK